MEVEEEDVKPVRKSVGVTNSSAQVWGSPGRGDGQGQRKKRRVEEVEGEDEEEEKGESERVQIKRLKMEIEKRDQTIFHLERVVQDMVQKYMIRPVGMGGGGFSN